MARENHLRLRAIVDKEPRITKNPDGTYAYAIVVLAIARPNRDTGDKLSYAQISKPRLMTQNPEMIKEIETWKLNDVVDVKGVLATRSILKASYCPKCHTKNTNNGSFAYIVPLYAEKIMPMPDAKLAMQYLLEKREISNSLRAFGTLLTNPKMLTTFAGLDFTQYKLALNRKFLIKEDDPSRKVDYPWVKTYGDRARLDRFRLQKGSEIYIDGCLQEREIRRKAFCGQLMDDFGQPQVSMSGESILRKDGNGNSIGCGQEYYWKDRTIEIVPFSVEYVSNVLTEEQAEERQRMRILQHEKDNGSSALFNRTLYDTLTDKDYEDGIDDEDSDYKYTSETDDEYQEDNE